MFLVGENNSGKTTLLQSIDFLLSGLPRAKSVEEVRNLDATSSDELAVTIEIKGEVREAIQNFSESKYSSYVFEDDGKETLRLRRSSQEEDITQSGKTLKMNITKLRIWNPETSQFENPSGIDKTFKLMETQFIWSDTDPGDVVDFGSTKTCGKLMGEVFSDFQKTEKWEEFEKSHKSTFHGIGSLDEKANEVGEEIRQVFASQYGDVGVKFSFPFPDSSSFFKNVNLNIDDGHETRLEEKGSGMQRSIALAIIQVYAKRLVAHATDPSVVKPLFFFIDEPEISLHPVAQNLLMLALRSISSTQQVVIATHSPVNLKAFIPSSDKMFVFSRNKSIVSVADSGKLSLFDWSPSWGEIMYFAFNTATVEFHNELYGVIQERSGCYTLAAMDAHLNSSGFAKDKTWIKVAKGVSSPPESVTLATFIRNTIHHPENRSNANFSEGDLSESIGRMISLL